MSNYDNAKIYKLINLMTDDIYIGSTIKPLHIRLSQHISCAKRNSQSKLYQSMRNIGINQFKMIHIEDYKCENKKQLERREGYYQKKLQPTLNDNYEGMTKEEKLERKRNIYHMRKESMQC
jgi:group I intron endonuclease